MTLPVFIICVTALALIINIISICENIVFIMCREVRDMDVNAYKVKAMEAEGIMNTFSYFTEETILQENPQISQFNVKNLDYLYSAENIDDLIGVDVKTEFAVDNPLGIYGEIEFVLGILSRGFTGCLQDGEPLPENEFKSNGQDVEVWIFPKYGKKYHIPKCRYVRQDYEGEEYKIEMQKEDARRKGYTPCLVCGGENE